MRGYGLLGREGGHKIGGASGPLCRSGSTYLATFAAGLLADWDLGKLAGSDGSSVTTVPAVSVGPALTGGTATILRATGWSDGGRCVELGNSGSASYLSANSLAPTLYGPTGGAFTVAALIRTTGSNGGCVFGLGSAAGVQAQGYLSHTQPAWVSTGGGSTASWVAPTWIQAYPTEDMLIVFSVDQMAAGFVWADSQFSASDTGFDSTNTYNTFSLGSLILSGSPFNSIGALLRRASVWSGVATPQRVSAIVQAYGATYALRRGIRIDGNSRTAGNGSATPWPSLLTAWLLDRDIGRKAANCPQATIFNAGVGGEAVEDVQTPTSPPPDGDTGYKDGQSASNVYHAISPATSSAILGVPGSLLGIGGGSVDENGLPNYDSKTPPILIMGDPFHDLWRGWLPAQVIQRMRDAVAAARVAAPGCYIVALDCLPGVVALWSQANADAYNTLVAAQGVGADMHIAWSTCPGMTLATGGGYQNESGVFVHPTTAGAQLLADFVGAYFAAIRAGAAATMLARMSAGIW